MVFMASGLNLGLVPAVMIQAYETWFATTIPTAYPLSPTSVWASSSLFRENAADGRDGHVGCDENGPLHGAEHRIENQEDDEQGARHIRKSTQNAPPQSAWPLRPSPALRHGRRRCGATGRFAGGGRSGRGALPRGAAGPRIRRKTAARRGGSARTPRLARQFGSLNEEVAAAQGETAVVQVQLDRANNVMEYSTKYQIPADLAGLQPGDVILEYAGRKVISDDQFAEIAYASGTGSRVGCHYLA